jgi:hypothetical protein
MQISGVSYQIAKTITKQVTIQVKNAHSLKYPNFQSLMKMYECEGLTQQAKENLLANLERVDSSVGKRLGPALSKKIYAIFNEEDGSKLVQDL